MSLDSIKEAIAANSDSIQRARDLANSSAELAAGIWDGLRTDYGRNDSKKPASVEFNNAVGLKAEGKADPSIAINAELNIPEPPTFIEFNDTTLFESDSKANPSIGITRPNSQEQSDRGRSRRSKEEDEGSNFASVIDRISDGLSPGNRPSTSELLDLLPGGFSLNSRLGEGNGRKRDSRPTVVEFNDRSRLLESDKQSLPSITIETSERSGEA